MWLWDNALSAPVLKWDELILGREKKDVMAQIWTMPACVNLQQLRDDVMANCFTTKYVTPSLKLY